MSLTAVASNPFERYKGVKRPDERKEKKIEPSGLEDVLRRYRRLLEEFPDVDFYLRPLGTDREPVAHVLTPEKINEFLQLTIPYEAQSDYEVVTGIFITKLVRNSYQSGFAEFHLDTNSHCGVQALAARLPGTKKRPLEIIIKGNAGRECGAGARHLKLRAEGDAGDLCGYMAHCSTFAINTAGVMCGSGAFKSTFHIRGNVGENCGIGSKRSTFYLHGIFGKILDLHDPARDSTFVVYTRDHYERALREVAPGNRIILADQNNKIIEEDKL